METSTSSFAVASGGTGAITAQGAAQNLGVPWMLSKAGIPFVKAPTGTMANNGAVTFGTALPRIYSNGAWIWYAAGAVAAGTPATASWLWTVMSSTTVGVVFNSTYSSGTPAIGTTTAFVTTGPGAFAGDTGEITAITISMPAGSMGLNGLLEWLLNFSTVSNANSKTVKFKFGGTTYTSETVASLVGSSFFGFAQNTGVASAQIGGPAATTSHAGIGNNSGANVTSAIDTMGGAVSLTVTITATTATDYVVLENYWLRISYGA
jgi:hypothetical protein